MRCRILLAVVFCLWFERALDANESHLKGPQRKVVPITQKPFTCPKIGEVAKSKLEENCQHGVSTKSVETLLKSIEARLSSQDQGGQDGYAKAINCLQNLSSLIDGWAIVDGENRKFQTEKTKKDLSAAIEKAISRPFLQKALAQLGSDSFDGREGASTVLSDLVRSETKLSCDFLENFRVVDEEASKRRKALLKECHPVDVIYSSTLRERIADSPRLWKRWVELPKKSIEIEVADADNFSCIRSLHQKLTAQEKMGVSFQIPTKTCRESQISRLRKLLADFSQSKLEVGSEWVKADIKMFSTAKPLTDISCLKFTTRLESLMISGSEVEDLSPIQGLQNIRELDLDRSKVQNLDALKNFQRLEKLSLRNTPVFDLSPIKGLVSLRELHIDGTQVVSLQPIAKLKQLTNISAENTQISNLEPLRNLTRLRDLSLYKTPVFDLSPLKNLKELRNLGLRQTKVASIAPLKGIELDSLSIDETFVTDISPLAQAKNLLSLSFNETKVSEMKVIRNFPNLRYLRLNGTLVSDLSPIENLKSLEAIQASRTPVSVLPPMAGLKRLDRMDLSYTDVKDLFELSEAKTLSSLNLKSTPVSDLTPLSRHERLFELNLSQTKVVDLAPLTKHLSPRENLVDLNLTQTRVADISPLANLNNLVELNLSGTQVRSVEPLRKIRTLKELILTGAPVEDLTPITKNPPPTLRIVR